MFPPELMEKNFPSEITFASLLVYSPRGSSNLSELSRTRVRDAVKRGDPKAISLAAQRILGGWSELGYFGDDVFIVPVPRHAPTRRHVFWPTKTIGDSFVDQGLAIGCTPLLKRSIAIEKSALSSGPRTVARHLYSIDLVPTIHAPERIVVLDDVVTSGATLFAATCIIAEEYPNADVKAFALVRTLSNQEVPETPARCLAPCIGTIRMRSDCTTVRKP